MVNMCFEDFKKTFDHITLGILLGKLFRSMESVASPFSPCTTISRAVNRTCLIYWMCFASYQGRPNHASLAIRHNTWFLIQLSAHSLFSKSEIHNSGITDYILLLFLLTANILDC